MRISRLFLAALLAVGMSLSGISLYAQDETTNEGTTATFQHRFDRGMRGPRALGLQFVDENGNGINDRLEDDDGEQREIQGDDDQRPAQGGEHHLAAMEADGAGGVE